MARKSRLRSFRLSFYDIFSTALSRFLIGVGVGVLLYSYLMDYAWGLIILGAILAIPGMRKIRRRAR